MLSLATYNTKMHLCYNKPVESILWLLLKQLGLYRKSTNSGILLQSSFQTFILAFKLHNCIKICSVFEIIFFNVTCVVIQYLILHLSIWYLEFRFNGHTCACFYKGLVFSGDIPLYLLRNMRLFWYSLWLVTVLYEVIQCHFYELMSDFMCLSTPTPC